MHKGVREKKSYFFVIDALIAIALLTAIVITVYKPVEKNSRVLRVFLVSNDYMTFLKNTHVRELSNELIEPIVYNITSPDMYITDAIGEMYYKSKQDCPECLDNLKIFLNNLSKKIILKQFAYKLSIIDSGNKTVLYSYEPFNINDSRILASTKKMVFVMNDTELVGTYLLKVEVGSK